MAMSDESKSQHWDSVYASKRTDEVSWYRPHLEQSLAFIESAGLSSTDPILDVGGGASTLVDDLLDRGHGNLTVVDLSATALERVRARLGPRANAVRWLQGDITRLTLARGEFAFWHDRAVFHFLQDEGDRARYVAAVLHALRPGGYLLVATFGPGGPDRCSGLDVRRYSADALHAEFGPAFRRLDSRVEYHVTPSGKQQEFVSCFSRREP